MTDYQATSVTSWTCIHIMTGEPVRPQQCGWKPSKSLDQGAIINVDVCSNHQPFNPSSRLSGQGRGSDSQIPAALCPKPWNSSHCWHCGGSCSPPPKYPQFIFHQSKHFRALYCTEKSSVWLSPPQRWWTSRNLSPGSPRTFGSHAPLAVKWQNIQLGQTVQTIRDL